MIVLYLIKLNPSCSFDAGLKGASFERTMAIERKPVSGLGNLVLGTVKAKANQAEVSTVRRREKLA